MRKSVVVLVCIGVIDSMALRAMAQASEDEVSRIESLVEEVNQEQVEAAVLQLQPWYSRAKTERVRVSRRGHLDRLVEAITVASKTNRIDPLLSVAVAFRESSLMPVVGLGSLRGRHGDLGYFQILPGGAAIRVCGTCQDLDEPMCNALVATCYMRRVQEHCKSTNPWIWLGGYGRSRCASSLHEARQWGEVRRARSLYCKVREDCATYWPE